MALGEFPTKLLDLPYSARVRRAVELGRQSLTNKAAASQLAGWRTGGFTARLLATFACHGSRDSVTLAQLAADPSRSVARAALAVMCHVGDDETLLATLLSLPPRLAAKTLLKIRRSRQSVVDRFIITKADAGDTVAWALVALGSSTILDRYRTLAAERGGGVYWRRLAVIHPERAANEMVTNLNAAENPDGLLFASARTVIDTLSDLHPEPALKVVNALKRHATLASLSLNPLAIRRPATIADLVVGSVEPPTVIFERVAHKLSVERIVALYRRSPQVLGNPDRWLARLPVEARAAIYQELILSWTSADGLVAIHLIRRLPAALRVSEARRMIALPVLAARPLQRLPYIGLLPWSEVRELSAMWLGHPEAENRAAALAALCEATRFDQSHLSNLLEMLSSRKFEQDPVRSVFLTAIAALPPSRWSEAHLVGLARVIRDALDAADLSANSTAALGRLLFNILPFQPKWAVEQIALLTRERGFPAGGPTRGFTVEDIERIAPVLSPVIKKWLDREHANALVSLAVCVGHRLPHWPELVNVLEKAVHGTVQQYIAATAMTLLVTQLPKERERIVTKALAQDESWVLQPSVMNYLHVRRQDLLTPFLGQRAYSGRFSTGRVRHVLPLATGFHRWHDLQQETFAASLAELAEPPRKQTDAQITWDVLHAIRRLPALPAVGPERLISLARDSRVAVQEAAVRALGRIDARQGIPELLEALGDARARWAVYALRAALADLPPAHVLSVMRTVPLGKVTVAKEAIRLVGEFGGEAAVGWFTELDKQPLHRDVRGALLRALWDHLESSEAWNIIDSSSTSPDPSVVIGLSRIQVERASPEARARVANLLLRLLGHPEPSVRVAVLDRLALLPVADPSRKLLIAALEALASAIPDERASALRAAFAAATDADAPRFASSFTRLLTRRRELAAAVDLFANQSRYLGQRLLALRSAVLEAVEADPAAASLHIRLAAARFAARPFAAWVKILAGSSRWHAGTQFAVLNVLVEHGRAAEELEQAEAAWAAESDPGLRWLALRLLFQAAASQGWTVERRRRLDNYRLDLEPAVADEAAFTFPPDPTT